MKPRIVLSGVNLNKMGPLMVFQDALASLVKDYAEGFEVIALVHRKSLFDIPNIKFIEYPEIKSSWWKRIRFEYYDCKAISKKLVPHLWVSMDNVTPNVSANHKVVYCHNPSAFYPFSLREAVLDWRLGVFTLLFGFVYGINIKSNNFVIVQQDWIRKKFQSRYAVRNVIVAHPSVNHLAIAETMDYSSADRAYRFVYPAYPRTFKNAELILEAARKLESEGFNRFEVWLTMNGSETPYAEKIRQEFLDLTTVRWMGLQPRPEVMRLYAAADCLIFPSKLETWGMPITEFKTTGKPILAADLPYAHETVGDYDSVAFFATEDYTTLAAMMKKAAKKVDIFTSHSVRPISEPFCRNWNDLWRILLIE